MSAHKVAPMIMIGVLLLAGCAASPTDIQRRILTGEEVAKRDPNARYVVYPPDKLRIESPANPELTREVVVRQDGYVTLPFLQDVKVAGLTPVQIKEELERSYAKFYTDARIIVTVMEFNSKRVFVYGEVPGRTGTLPYTGSQTVADVIGQVGGITHRAAPSRVRVVRGDVDSPEVFRVDLAKLLYEGDATQNVLLAEKDVIYVPPNFLAWLGYQIDNLLFPFRGLISAALGYETIRDTRER